MATDGQIPVPAKNKHLQILAELRNLETGIERVASLQRRVECTNEPDCESETKSDELGLAQFLEIMPERIAKDADHLNQLVSQVEGMLF